MSVTVRMPQLGETVTEGTILRWAKQPGDRIAEDEVLLEVSTDKVDTEVPSPTAGMVLEILVPAGETVPVGTALAVIGEAAETPAPAVAAMVPREAERGVGAEEGPVNGFAMRAGAAGSPASPNGGFLSPVVRKLAAEYGLDLGEVLGTGRGGRVTRKDVQAFIDARARGGVAALVPPPAAPAPVSFIPVVEILPAAPAAPVEAPEEEWDEESEEITGEMPALPKRVGLGRGLEALIRTGRAPAVAVPPTGPAAPAGPEGAAPTAPGAGPPAMIPLRTGDQVEDPSRLRLRIAEHMVANRRTAAHVWTAVEVDYEAVERVRRRHQEAFKGREGFSLTYLPFISRATIDALNAFPVVNSSFYLEEKKRVLHGVVNLGIAVDLDQSGLIVMNIPAADGMRMRELARRIRGVAEKARRGNLVPDDAVGSTFTITNPGPYGSFLSAPIINVPEVAILSTETVSKRPVVVTDGVGNDAIAIHHIGYLGLTWDHRAFDGSTAVLFLRRIKEILETRDWEQELA